MALAWLQAAQQSCKTLGKGLDFFHALPYVEGLWRAGVLEIDPCFAWQQQVMAGVGVAPDARALYKDMHSYLQGEAAIKHHLEY